MRLPVLESIIDGGDYNLSFPTGVLFGDYYNKSLKNDFDYSFDTETRIY